MTDHEIVLLETINPADLTVEELWALADQLHEQVPELNFAPASEEQHGAGVTWHEVIRVWVENREAFETAGLETAFGLIIAAMRKRFKKAHGERRPKSVIAQDKSTGLEIKTVVLYDAESPPVDVAVKVIVRPVPRQQTRGDE
jgi:hypothetical protein